MSTATMNTQTPISELDYLQKIHRLDCEVIKLLTDTNEMALQIIAKLESDLQRLKDLGL
jgi:hypothetical protein